MKNKILLLTFVALLACMLAFSVSAAPAKPTLDVDFGNVETIDGFTPPSELYVGTDERVVLSDGNGGYVTYPTYYVTKNSTTFDFDFSKLNGAQSIEYTKKSVVLVEIPDGVTAVSNSYFAGTGNFPICVSVQVPGSVTSYGSGMFQTNTVIRMVEFLDGTEPVTMGDGMFSSNWSVGTTKLEYVRFPNNLVSIGNNTFGKSHANKTIILGANLKSIGAGFFGESTPDNKDTNIYVSEKFFADVEMLDNLFGGFDQYHNNTLKLTLFYTGTQAQAQALVDKGVAVKSGYVWSNAKLISASEYDSAKDKPKPGRNSILIVYDYEKCDVFYDGHSYKGEIDVIRGNYFEPIKIGDSCLNCQKATVVSTINPIFEWKGYSKSTFGENYSVVQGFYIDREALAQYKVYAPDFDFGIMATGNAKGEAITPQIGDAKVFTAIFDNKVNDYYDVKVTGISADLMDKNIVFCIYVLDGGKMYYLDGEKTGESVVGISYNNI